MADQPALWADPLWTDAYVPGQPIHDGVRDGIVSDIIEAPGAMSGMGLVVRYPNGHETVFGWDHTISESSPPDSDPGVLAAPGISGGGFQGPTDVGSAPDGTAAFDEAAGAPAATFSSARERSTHSSPRAVSGRTEAVSGQATSAITHEKCPALRDQPGQ